MVINASTMKLLLSLITLFFMLVTVSAINANKPGSTAGQLPKPAQSIGAIAKQPSKTPQSGSGSNSSPGAGAAKPSGGYAGAVGTSTAKPSGGYAGAVGAKEESETTTVAGAPAAPEPPIQARFVQSNPIIVCLDFQREACRKLADKKWTLHGLWGQNDPPTASGDVDKVAAKNLDKKIAKRLEKSWPSHNPSWTSLRFWSHEWINHGRHLVNRVSLIKSMDDYFSEADVLVNKYNVRYYLEKKGLLHYQQSSIDVVRKAIEDEMKVKVQLRCAENIEPPNQYLKEIRVCLAVVNKKEKGHMPRDVWQPVNCYKNQDATNCNSKIYTDIYLTK